MPKSPTGTEMNIQVMDEDGKQSFTGTKRSRGMLLLRLWQYLGRNRLLLVLALFLSVSGSLFSLYGPKLSGQAINAINLGYGKVDFQTVYSCVILMAIFYLLSAVLT